MNDFDLSDFSLEIEDMDIDSLAAHARLRMLHLNKKNDSIIEKHLEKELKRIQKKLKKIKAKKQAQ